MYSHPHQILTLSRRAAQIYESSFPPGEVHPNDKDSVALLLALRQSGASDSNNPGSWNASGESSTHSASYPKGVQVRDEPPVPTANGTSTSPNTATGRNIGKGWIGMIGGAHGAVPSPASSGGHEDDHSQRLYVVSPFRSAIMARPY